MGRDIISQLRLQLFLSIMAAIAVPHHKLYESPNTRSIDVHGWRITACTNPISSAVECDALQAELGLPLPEMIFGNNSLVIHHQSSKWQYSFDALNALKAVRNGELQEGDGGVKVGYADAWLKSRYECHYVISQIDVHPVQD